METSAAPVLEADSSYNPLTGETTVPQGYIVKLCIKEYSQGYGEGYREGLDHGEQHVNKQLFADGFTVGQKSGLYLGLTVGFSLISVLAAWATYLLTH